MECREKGKGADSGGWREPGLLKKKNVWDRKGSNTHQQQHA